MRHDTDGSRDAPPPNDKHVTHVTHVTHVKHVTHVTHVTHATHATHCYSTTTMPRNKQGPCALCGRDKPLTFHHLIPRKMHRRTRFRKDHDRDELNAGIELCSRCHRGLHRLFDEMTLGRDLNTLDALRENEAVRRHVAWVAKQKS